jgi:hypothetical protein
VQDLAFTHLDFRDETIAIGTNVGLVYFFVHSTNELHKLRCEVGVSNRRF